ncbi:MAG: helix-turn-helix domain-containing protein [Dehalococcoidales bacterium]|nr:helix-turn-helix domain-containing protein [Dehalococcoidales bacterium]
MAVTLAQLIRAARMRLSDMTQGDLGKTAGTSLENVTAIENGRNFQPSPELIAGLSAALDLPVEDIYASIAGTLDDYPWEKPREIDLRDAELELMFRQVDNLLEGEPKDRVKSFIRFTLNEERRRRKLEKEEK